MPIAEIIQLLLLVGPDVVDEIMKLLNADPKHVVTPDEWKTLKAKISTPFDKLWPIQT